MDQITRTVEHPNGDVVESVFVRDPESGVLRAVQIVQVVAGD